MTRYPLQSQACSETGQSHEGGGVRICPPYIEQTAEALADRKECKH